MPTTASGCVRNNPAPMTAKTAPRKSSIGSMRTRALSATPYRLTVSDQAGPSRAMPQVWCAERGNTDARLAAPAARLTATVST